MSDEQTTKGLVLVAGAGPGLGTRLLRRFKHGGYDVVGITRSVQGATVDGFDLIRADLTCPKQAVRAVDEATGKYGPPRIVIHNTAELVVGSFAELTAADFEVSWRSTALSAVYLAKATLELMVQRGGGVFIVSGATASLRGGARFAAFASAKFALRGLVQSLGREYQPKNIHVAHVILDGIIDTARSRARHTLDPGRMMKPHDIADVYWAIAHQPTSAWSHEVDLRPMSETF